MKDRFEREIDYLRISVTDRCNLRCFYCMPEEGIDKKKHEDILRDEEILAAVQAATKLGLKKIRITGGEPLVRKGIFDLVRAIADTEGVEEVVMTTNGILLQGNVNRLKEAGIERVNLSMDTLNPETYQRITKTGSFPNYHAILQELIEHDLLPVKINCVLLKGINDREISDFLDLADRYDLHVRFIELMPIGHLPYDYKKHFISKQDVLKRHPELEFDKKYRVAEYYTVKNQRGNIGFINAMSHHFCNQCNRLRLTADGKLKPCLHTNEEIDIRHQTADELYRTFQKAIRHKPQNHKLHKEENAILRSMNKIGG